MTNKKPSMPNPTFHYGSDQMTAQTALRICRAELSASITAERWQIIEQSAKTVKQLAEGEAAVYGINTGFGPLCSTKISKEDTAKLQHNLIISHSVGVGEKVPEEIAKLMLILKTHALCQGYSGISVATLKRILWHIERDVIPVVPRQGSVGASGDLAPLAHLFLPLLGLGQVHYKGAAVPTDKALQAEGLSPIELQPKEGLALINGTQFIAAYAVQVVDRLQQCLSQADIIGAMMIEGLLGSASPFHPELHKLRPYPGNQHVAARIQQLLKGSAINMSHEDCERVQDPYSLRCIPQVHGASRTAWLHLRHCLEIELNAVTDNPVVLPGGLSISGGNFHGQPMALPLDYACLAAAEVGNISDRRSYLSLTGIDEAVPKLLMKETGTNSGFMILQYTAAALVSENKGLCFPASADSITTSLGQEDHVSMGSIGGRKALRVIENLEKILAIELLCAAQAMDFQRPLKSTPIIEAVHHSLRERVPHAHEDRIFAEDINAAIAFVRSGEMLAIARQEGLQTDWEEQFEPQM
jgi:histidine ammonia-lyase